MGFLFCFVFQTPWDYIVSYMQIGTVLVSSFTICILLFPFLASMCWLECLALWWRRVVKMDIFVLFLISGTLIPLNIMLTIGFLWFFESFFFLITNRLWVLLNAFSVSIDSTMWLFFFSLVGEGWRWAHPLTGWWGWKSRPPRSQPLLAWMMFGWSSLDLRNILILFFLVFLCPSFLTKP